MVTPLRTGEMNVVRVAWSGFLGGPGVSTFYSDGGQVPNLAALKTFFASVANSIPTSVILTYPSVGQVINSADGTLTGSWSLTAPANSTFSGTGNYNAAGGLQVVWKTDTVADGHAIKGRTFIVPITSGSYGTDGRVLPATAASVKAAGDVLAAAAGGKWHVWHRPKRGPKPTDGSPAPIIRPGGIADITGAIQSTLPVVLTSRRD